MREFTFHSPVKVIFGDQSLEQLPVRCAGRTVMIVHAGGSVVRSGTLTEVTSVLQDAGIAVVDCSDMTIADQEALDRGLTTARQHGVDCVIGLGGATCLDLAKIIGFGLRNDDLTPYFSGEQVPDNDAKALTILISTYPSTGSETNGWADLEDGRVLNGVFADVSLLVPRLTASMDARNTAYGALVVLIQATVNFFGNQNPLCHDLSVSVLRTTLKTYQRLLAEPTDLEARGSLMWASCLTTTPLASLGEANPIGWSLYQVGGQFKSVAGVNYRQCITVLFPRWLTALAKHQPALVHDYCVSIFGVDPDLSPIEAAEAASAAFTDLVVAGGLPTSYDAHGPRPSDEAARHAGQLAADHNAVFNTDECERLLLDCYA